MLIDVLWAVCLLFLLCLWATILLSYVSVIPGTGLDRFGTAVNAIVRPILNPVRRLLPATRVGGIGVDFSPVIVSVFVLILMRLLD